ncbi:hypothetical protein RB653_005308 [Dictyostelium firmibasis]|uniref:Transmembrane protein n=1 Tax=Dictyostelium firmibasis TaxID=79012 RepID=A0AAN7UCD1_9MYCE
MIKFNKFLSLLIIFLIINCNYQFVKADAESKALDIINRYRDIARYTFFTTDGHLERYPSGFCGGTPVDDCKWDEYIEAVILLSAITLIIAAITLIFGIIFWIFRCICFGGCRPTHGVCCPGPKYDPDIGEGYTSGKVLILKLVTLVMVAGCVAVFITALKGNSSTTSGINNLSDTVFNKTSYTLEQLIDISNDLNQTKYEQFDQKKEIQDQLTQLIDDGENLQTKGEDISNNAKDVNNIRTKIIVIGLVFCMVAAGIIGIAAIFGLPKIARFGSILLVILIPFMWIVFSVHYPINSVVADVCISYDETGVQQFSNYSNPIITQVFDGCKNESNTISAFEGLESLVNDLLKNATDTSCSKVNDACQLGFPRYPNDDPTQTPYQQNVLDCPINVTCGNSTLSIFLFNSTVHDFNYKCKNAPTCGDTSTCDPSVLGNIMTCGWVNVSSINACSQGACQYNAQVVNTTKQIMNLYDLLTSLTDIWTEKVVPLIKCSYLIPFVDEIQSIVCVDEVNSLDLLIAPTAIFAILLTGLGITGILGSKRFNSHYKVKSSA